MVDFEEFKKALRIEPIETITFDDRLDSAGGSGFHATVKVRGDVDLEFIGACFPGGCATFSKYSSPSVRTINAIDCTLTRREPYLYEMKGECRTGKIYFRISLEGMKYHARRKMEWLQVGYE